MLSKMWFSSWRAAAIGSLALLTVYFSVLTLRVGLGLYLGTVP